MFIFNYLGKPCTLAEAKTGMGVRVSGSRRACQPTAATHRRNGLLYFRQYIHCVKGNIHRKFEKFYLIQKLTEIKQLSHLVDKFCRNLLLIKVTKFENLFIDQEIATENLDSSIIQSSLMSVRLSVCLSVRPLRSR